MLSGKEQVNTRHCTGSCKCSDTSRSVCAQSGPGQTSLAMLSTTYQSIQSMAKGGAKGMRSKLPKLESASGSQIAAQGSLVQDAQGKAHLEHKSLAISVEDGRTSSIICSCHRKAEGRGVVNQLIFGRLMRVKASLPLVCRSMPQEGVSQKNCM